VHVSLPPPRSLGSISTSLLPHFKEAAENLIEERGAVEVVAAALAHIAGARDIVSRSLLSAQQVKGFLVLPECVWWV